MSVVQEVYVSQCQYWTFARLYELHYVFVRQVSGNRRFRWQFCQPMRSTQDLALKLSSGIWNTRTPGPRFFPCFQNPAQVLEHSGLYKQALQGLLLKEDQSSHFFG